MMIVFFFFFIRETVRWAMYFDPTGPAFVCTRVRVKYLHCAGPSADLRVCVYVVDDDHDGRNRRCPQPLASSSRFS